MIRSARVLCLIIALFQTGCLSNHYGLDKETWEGLSEAQKTATITSYNRRKELEAQRQLLDAERRLLEARAAQEAAQARAAVAIENAPRIKVRITDGRLRHDGNTYSIKETEIVLRHGTRTRLKLNHQAGSGGLPAIPVAYVRGKFIFGPEKAGPGVNTSLEFPFEKDWLRGETYWFQSIPFHAPISGKISLEIKALRSDNDEEDDLLIYLLKEALD